MVDKSCRWWRCTCIVLLKPTASPSPRLNDDLTRQDFPGCLPPPYSKCNPAWFLHRRRIYFPINFHISFTSFSVYNARSGSEADRNVKYRSNQRISPTRKWCDLSLHQAHAWTLGWSENVFFGKCKVSMSQKFPYGNETLYTKFELDLWGVRTRTKSLNFKKNYMGPKNNFVPNFL